MSEVDLPQSSSYLIAVGAGLLVVVVHYSLFWFLRLIANFLIWITIGICAVLPFFVLQSGTLASSSDIWIFSVILGTASAIVCMVVYPYSSIYENKMKEKIAKAMLRSRNPDI